MGLGACLLVINIAGVLCMVHVVANFTKEGNFKINKQVQKNIK
jgi:hypothetical protein